MELSSSPEIKLLSLAVQFLITNDKITPEPPPPWCRESPVDPKIAFANLFGKDSLMRWTESKGDLVISVWWGYESERQPMRQRERYCSHPQNPRDKWRQFVDAIVTGKFIRTDRVAPYVTADPRPFFAPNMKQALKYAVNL
jgi:hypothetical protein